MAQAVTLGSTELMFRRCKFINATGSGVVCANSTWFWDCDFNDNSGDGVSCAYNAFFNCRFYNNTLSGIDADSLVTAWNCTFFSNGSHAIDGGGGNELHVIAINCTIDGNSSGAATDVGVEKNSANRGMIAIINCIVYDCVTGSTCFADERDLLLNNLFNSNTTDFSNSGTDQEGTFQTAAPDFVNEAAGADYTLNSASPAVSAGHDEDDNMDIGSHQRPAAGGGGGLLGPNMRAGML